MRLKFSLALFGVGILGAFLLLLAYDPFRSSNYQLTQQAEEGRVLIVCPEGCLFTAIQDAIDAAKPGDTIIVRAGVYGENLTITKSLKLQGEDPLKVKVHPKDSQDPTLLISDTSDVVIQGLTVAESQIGILVQQSDATLSNNRFLVC